jgi:formyltetrahydrofolate deformylase
VRSGYRSIVFLLESGIPVSSNILTVSCPSGRGIVASISSYLAGCGCNIIDSSQFDDLESRSFFMRVSFLSEEGTPLGEIVDGFAAPASALHMRYQFHDAASRMRVLIMVSRFGHCLNDLLYRWRVGALPIDIVGVVSNHLDFQKIVVNYDIPFHYIRVAKDSKPHAEAQLMQLVEETGSELIVLARYMQVLSDDLCRKMAGRIINIHHSFLPSFKGANPYRQAYERGVKLIGATAHYVTPELDEGPIIEQDIIRITHAQSPDDYVSLGRDVESQVLARAVHAHIHHRTLLNGGRVIVFPASPGDYAG